MWETTVVILCVVNIVGLYIWATSKTLDNKELGKVMFLLSLMSLIAIYIKSVSDTDFSKADNVLKTTSSIILPKDF